MLLIDVVHSKNCSQLVRRVNGHILVPVVNTSIINSINDHMYNCYIFCFMPHIICTVKRQSSAYEINRQFCKCLVFERKRNFDRRGQIPLSNIYICSCSHCTLPLTICVILRTILYIVSRGDSMYIYNISTYYLPVFYIILKKT